MRFVWIALFLSLFEQITSPKNSTPSNTYISKSTRSNTNRQGPNQSIVRSRSFTFGTATSGNGGDHAAASSSFGYGYGTYGETSPGGYGGTSPGYASYISGQLSSGGRSHGYHSSGGRHSSDRRSYGKQFPNSDDLSAYYGTPSPYDPAENAEILSELKRFDSSPTAASTSNYPYYPKGTRTSRTQYTQEQTNEWWSKYGGQPRTVPPARDYTQRSSMDADLRNAAPRISLGPYSNEIYQTAQSVFATNNHSQTIWSARKSANRQRKSSVEKSERRTGSGV